MRKKLLFVESNTTGTGMILLNKTKRWGYDPVFLTQRPNVYVGLNETGCEIVSCDTNSISDLIQVIRSTFNSDDIAGIMTTSEYYLTIVSELTKVFGLPGNPPDVLTLCRNKYKTRLALSEAKINQPKFSAVHSVEELEKEISKIGLPCVVKPTDESSSNDVRVCETLEEAIKQFHVIFNKPHNARGQAPSKIVLVEEFLHDQEYSVEMFTWQGVSSCVGITEKHVKGYPYFIEYKHIFPARLTSDLESEIIKTVAAALEAIGFVNGVTHTEIKWTNKGCAIIEINARPAGGMIPELIQAVTEVDLLELQTKSAIGEKPLVTINYTGCAGIHFIVSDQPGDLVEIQGVDQVKNLDGIQQVTLTSKAGDQVCVPKNASHRLGFIIAKTTSYEDTCLLLDKAINMIKVNVKQERQSKLILNVDIR
ncbi:ATP-grasp domain-containing protein [Metabacillus halosaccharovorans]|uniref:ATP-grasp domain-containing protein n=1 Tax=Metabacillus halosaccharovorans TaxID=930124 RepID=UPI00403DA5B3